MTEEAREVCIDLFVEGLMAYAETIGYKAEEPEECVRWELAKAFYKELKEEIEYEQENMESTKIMQGSSYIETR